MGTGGATILFEKYQLAATYSKQTRTSDAPPKAISHLFPATSFHTQVYK